VDWAEHVQAVQDGGVGFPVVEVVWEDCSAFAVEWSETVETSPRIVTTVGYLVSENDGSLTLVMMINPNQVGHGVVIPVSGIISWRDLQ